LGAATLVGYVAGVRATLGYGILFLKPAARFKNKILPRRIPRRAQQCYNNVAFKKFALLFSANTLTS
jgi:hypothetical protein